MPNRDQQASTN